jgi:hypothetical protein
VSGLLAAAGRRPRDLSRPREPNRPRDHRRPRDRGQDRDVLGVGDSAPVPLGSQ